MQDIVPITPLLRYIKLALIFTAKRDMPAPRDFSLYSSSLEKLRHYIEQENFKGYDPYDTLNSAFKFRYLGKFAAVLALQFQKRNPYVPGQVSDYQIFYSHSWIFHENRRFYLECNRAGADHPQNRTAAHYLVCTTTLTLIPGRSISLIAESA